MLTVKDNWKDVKVGDRVRVPAKGGYDGFEATVRLKGKQDVNSHVSGAWFTDNVTLKIDGTPRKTSAKSRRNQILASYRPFEILDGAEVDIPKTAGELTDAHIGMRFRFNGSPVIDGTYMGQDVGLRLYVEDVTYDSWVAEEGDISNPDRWGRQKNGYFIGTDRKLTYLGGTTPKDVDETVDIDAKLAAYFNQELDKVGSYTEGTHSRALPDSKGYGYHIVEILKTLTK